MVNGALTHTFASQSLVQVANWTMNAVGEVHASDIGGEAEVTPSRDCDSV